jgi:CRP-like cAMP-binding protein
MTPLVYPARGPRYDETFPVLTPREIDRLRRFGTLRKYAGGEKLFETGKPGPGMFVVLSGSVAITQRDGLGHVTPVVEQGAGQFLAEVGQLSNRRCHRNFRIASRGADLKDGLHAAVAARHVPSASSRRTRIVRREVKCRWVLKVF